MGLFSDLEPCFNLDFEVFFIYLNFILLFVTAVITIRSSYIRILDFFDPTSKLVHINRLFLCSFELVNFESFFETKQTTYHSDLFIDKCQILLDALSAYCLSYLMWTSFIVLFYLVWVAGLVAPFVGDTIFLPILEFL